MSLVKALQDVIRKHLDLRELELEQRQDEASKSNSPVTHATLVGGIMELEHLHKTLDKFIEDMNAKATPMDYINFEAMSNALGNDLPKDMPVKFAVLTGLGTAKPIATVNCTIADLQRMAAIVRMYKEDTGK